MSSTVYHGASHRSSSVRTARGSKPTSANRRAWNGMRPACMALFFSRSSCLRSMTSGGSYHADSKYSGGGGNSRAISSRSTAWCWRRMPMLMARPLSSCAGGGFEQPRRVVRVRELVEVDRVVPEDLALGLVADLVGQQVEEGLHRVRVLRVRVREVGLEQDAVVAHPTDDVGRERVLALGRDPAVAL